jgi:hypothetical protein
MTRTMWRGVRSGGVLLSLVALVAGAAGTSGVSARGVARVATTIPAGFLDWLEHGHDQYHTGVSGETILSASTAYKLHWSVNTGGTKAYSSPSVV